MSVRVAATLVLAAALAAGGCTSSGSSDPDDPGAGAARQGERADPDDAAAPGTPGCGPPRTVAGRRPAYVDRPLERFANDHHACRAAWLPETGKSFVPQGLVVRGERAWVSGYDGGGPEGTKYCRVLRVDLGGRDGPRLLQQRGGLRGEVGSRGAVGCRHAGGLVRDRHGLWLSETRRLWLLDPATLAVRRVWAVRSPLQGGFLVHDAAGRLGVGDYRDHGRPRLWWFSVETLLGPGLLDVSPAVAEASREVPTSSQGAVHGDLGPGGVRTWFVSADSRCGRLVGDGPPRGLVPGAEGASLDGGRLWVVSESASEVYSGYGDRPVVPHLVRLDVDDVGSWRRATCSPSG
ncbi:hypothetical protein G7072_19110 [Nocardioides sp. HDW12B]|uniref:hypothetical protein n=1 Tax=Nocardioides sp. HDW12B TaxID=2714939 RepID=UPI00140D5A37|nr:hypothetical protein [Nocardioides sp. HDW12B]QIK68166.1 hypothetical protein G7072_19110 [Nocardioides sp. HDW12B]